jgi:hypothetical protein
LEPAPFGSAGSASSGAEVSTGADVGGPVGAREGGVDEVDVARSPTTSGRAAVGDGGVDGGVDGCPKLLPGCDSPI